MDTILLTTQVILAIFLTIIILLQKSSSIGLGAYGKSNESLFGAKGAGGFLSKLTFTLGFLFVINTVALTYIYNNSKGKSVTDLLPANAAPVVVEDKSNNTPAAPNTKIPKPSDFNQNKKD